MLYWTGISLAIVSGLINGVGCILQKKVVNQKTFEREKWETDKITMKDLVKSPTWLIGIVLSMGIASIFYIAAQYIIGATLVPGLIAAGLMITLAIGSIKLLGEKLKKSEILGIFLMIGAIFLIAFSELDIPSIEIDVNDLSLLIRINLFLGLLVAMWLITYIIAMKKEKQKGLIIAFSAGFPFAITNLWITPLLASISFVYSRIPTIIELLFFIIACPILVLSSFYGIRQVQIAYKFSNASKVQPIQFIPNHITPVFIYFFVYLLPATLISLIFIVVGIIIIIIGGFLLAERQAEFERITN